MTDVGPILAYVLDENAKFHVSLAAAFKSWAESGALPPPIVSAKKAKRAKGAGSARAKSGYSMFVAEFIAGLKRNGVASLREPGKDYMSLAGAKWKTMSDAQKASYNDQAKAAAAAAGAGGSGAPLAIGSGDGEKKKKKKKRDREDGEHKKHKKHKKHHDSD